MNRLILIIMAVAALAGCATPKQKTPHPQVPTPDVAVVKAPIERARSAQTQAGARVDSARSSVAAVAAKVQQLQPPADQVPVVQEIQQGLREVDTQLVEARQQLQSAVGSLAEASGRADELQGAVNLLGTKYADAQADLTKAEANLAKEVNAHKATSAAYHRLKFFVALIAAIIAGLIATRFVPKTNLWWQIAAPIAVAAVAFIAAWLIL